MTNQVKELVSILQDQNKIYNALIDLSKELKQAVKDNNIEEVDMLVKVESALSMKFSVKENKRKQLAKAIQETYGIDSESFSLSELKKHLNSEDQRVIEKAQTDLIHSMKTLDEINASNHMLIQSRLDWIDLSMKVLGQSKQKNYTKDKKSAMENKMVDEVI